MDPNNFMYVIYKYIHFMSTNGLFDMCEMSRKNVKGW